MRAVARVGILLAAVCAGCGPSVDLGANLQVQEVSTGWFDAGIVNGQNKLVPTVSFKLINHSTENLPVLDVNVKFQRQTGDTEWPDEFKRVAGSEGLAPAASTSTLTLTSKFGYTGSAQSREDMLRNGQFVVAKVTLFAKYGSTQWTRLGEYPITRRLLIK